MNQATRVPLFISFLYCYLSAVVAVNKQCYDVYCFMKPDPVNNNDVQKTFTDAQQWCRDNNAMLLEIPDEHVQAAVQIYLSHNSFNSNPFLNAQFQQTNWIWTDVTPYNSNWGGAIQNGSNADARYAYVKFDQTNNRFGISTVTVWDATPRAFICQYSGDQCPPGISLTDGLCIGLNTSLSSWFGARLSCYRQGGDLASLHDLHMNLSSLANKLQSQTEYWIGLTNGQWSWQDSGTQMVYNNWQTGSPRYSTCLSLNNGVGLWMDCDCGANTRPFICLQNANLTSTSASQTFSPVMSISKSSYSQPKSTSKSSSQVTSFSKSSNETPSTSKSSNRTPTSESSSRTTSTTTFSDQRSTSKSNNQTISSMASSNQNNSLGLILGVSIGVGAPILIIVVVLLVVFRSKCGHKTLLDDTTKNTKRGPTISYETTSIIPRSLDANSDSTHRDSHAYQELHLANNNSTNHTPSVQENENLYDTTLADPENGSQVPSPDPALDELHYQELRRDGTDHIYTTPSRSIDNGVSRAS